MHSSRYLTHGCMVLFLVVPLWVAAGTLGQDEQATAVSGTKPIQKPDQSKPLSPREEQGTFRLDRHHRIELVAAEPEVVDPVAFCFDAKEDLYVVEMRGYPNGGVGEGPPNLPGRVKKLQDRDRDGYYETATVFLDNLRFPCAITPWRNGFLIGDAPDLFFAEDTDGDGKADLKRVLYTGFGPKNIQQMINGLQFHFDNWVYGCNGGNDSPVRSVEKPEAPVVQLRGMHFRFKPDVPASLEPTSGGGQYGLAVTSSGDWLTCTNSQHIRHIVLPDQYLKRNPYLAVPAVTLDIADHGAACKVFRLSPFEAWRVERTTRRAGSAESSRFPTTELVPGGFVTSGTGIAVWDASLDNGKLQEQVFVCDPANNLIHRDVLEKHSSTYRAKRHDQDCEFLASTDTWFRPVFLAEGPDRGLYVADFYREIIETPLSLPDDIKAKWNLNSRERGRIWRIIPRDDQPSQREKLDGLENERLISIFQLSNGTRRWRENTAQRLLFQQQAGPDLQKRVVSILKVRLSNIPHFPLAGIRAAWLAEGWGCNKVDHIDYLFNEVSAQSIIQALRLAERLPELPESLQKSILQQTDHADGHVRLQLAFSLGSLKLPDKQKVTALLHLAGHPAADHWLHTAVLSSARGVELLLLKNTLENTMVPTAFLEQLAKMAGRAIPGEVLAKDEALRKLGQGPLTDRHLAVLRGLGANFVRKQPALAAQLMEKFKQSQHNEAQRLNTIPLLGLVQFVDCETELRALLQAQQPLAIQQAALRALAGHHDLTVPKIILEQWAAWSPALRREAQEVLFSRLEFLQSMLTAAEQGKFPLGQLEPARREQLRRHSNAKVKARAQKLLTSQPSAPRAEVIKKYQPALELAGDPARGKAIFAKHCATCHQFDRQGHAVGPDLNSALGNKTKEALFLDLLDPNREVDSRYVNYVITTKQGRTLTGMIHSETAGSLTLRRAEGVEETCLRADIDEIQGTGQSLMPENVHEQMNVQETADLLEYLLSRRGMK